MGRNWAIVVGINHYENLRSLNFAKRDASVMATWFQQEAKFNEVFLFTDDSPSIPTNPPIPTQPTFGHLRRFLRAQFENALLKPEDNLWFFFAGHGTRYQDRDYLMFSDSDPGDIEHTAISVDYITQRLRRSGADNVVLFLDACRDESSRSVLGIGEQRHQGVITFYSCTANQKSWEIDELQHGSFTYSLLEGLRLQGEANCATVERLAQYLTYQVPAVNTRYGKAAQNPYLQAEPPYKLYFILLEQTATLRDVESLKLQAYKAEAESNLSLAKQLWVRVLAVSRGDLDAIEAIERIARKRGGFEPTITTFEPVTLSTGDRSASSEIQVFNFDVVTVNAKGQEIKQEKGQAEYFTEDLDKSVTLEMVHIPRGTFMMGTEDKEIKKLVKINWDWYRREKPQHKVTVKSFFIGKYPVTQAQWRRVAALPKVNRDLAADPSNFKGDNRPVEQVSWYDAMEFCSRLSKYTKKQYRLPSEAEWEYACRAGTTTPFHFGETMTTELANYNGYETYASEPKGKSRQGTTEVGSFPPNGFGLYDMHGQVWEWCQDTWHDSYEKAPRNGSAWIDNWSQYHLLRGGSWLNPPNFCRSAYRLNFLPDVLINHAGCRVVCAAGRILQ